MTTTSGAVTRAMPARGTVLMPVAKLSPISQATISITPWMPKVNMSDSTGSPVKFVMPSQVVQPPASDSTMAAVPSMASCQLVKNTSSIDPPQARPDFEQGDQCGDHHDGEENAAGIRRRVCHHAVESLLNVVHLRFPP